MHVLDANDIFGMTFYTADRILEEWGTIWPDALALYVKLIKQTRIQQTNQTKSLDVFLEEWLGRGYRRLKKAKDVLKWLWLMDSVIARDKLGKVVWHYVRVNFLIDEQKVRTSGITYNLPTTLPEAVLDESQLWPNAHKCLNNININALNTQIENNCPSEKKSTTSGKKKRTTNEHLLEWETKEKFEKFWNTYPHVTGRSSRKESIPLFLEHNPDDLVVGASILKWEVESWKQQDGFVKASERWLKNFTPITDSHKKRKIKEIMKRHMNTGWDKKTRFEEMQKDFEWVDLKAIAAEIRDEKTQELIESFKN